MTDTGRAGGPHILADLRPYHQLPNLPALKQQIRTHRHLHALPLCQNQLICPRSKMPCLIKFRIIGKMGLWHNSKNLSGAYGRRCIVQLPPMLPGKSHKHQHGFLPGICRDFRKLFSGRFNQRSLKEQISAGIPCHTQLRKYHQTHAQTLPFFDPLTNPLCVKHRICHPYFRGDCRCTKKTISHICLQSAAVSRQPGFTKFLQHKAAADPAGQNRNVSLLLLIQLG